jgi:hypothetical protein
MKLKDLEVAIASGTEVAVGRDITDGTARRCVVLAVRQERRVFSGARWDVSGHAARDGVRVRYLDGTPFVGAGTEQVVGPREILASWKDYRERHEAYRVKKQSEAQRLEDERVRCEHAARALGGQMRAITRDFRTLGWQVVLDLQTAERLAGGR